MSGVIVFESQTSLSIMPGGVFRRLVQSLLMSRSTNSPEYIKVWDKDTIEAQMRLDIQSFTASDLHDLLLRFKAEFEETTKELEAGQFIDPTKPKTIGYALAMSDLQIVTLFNLFKRSNQMHEISNGAIGKLHYRKCSWPAPKHIFNHCLERLAALAMIYDEPQTKDALLKSRVDQQFYETDLESTAIVKNLSYLDNALQTIESMISGAGLRFADPNLTAIAKPYWESLFIFLKFLRA